ncbi:isochorismatase [Deinococcus irradiatisoli]|uniref:Isochorismatase n=1 Tax=Deinococcus irradiatisoli TaxID=2202254 RepID=A0A2Z3JAC4_9DEIO|nr:isochorismatase [Deinococcus irradiatisoli]
MQRCHHEASEAQGDGASGRRLASWRQAVGQARQRGDLVVFLQRDGPAGSATEPLTRGWTLHPDFRVEADDALLRFGAEDAFAGSSLTLELRSRGVSSLSILALPGSPAAEATRRGAEQAGFRITAWQAPL